MDTSADLGIGYNSFQQQKNRHFSSPLNYNMASNESAHNELELIFYFYANNHKDFFDFLFQ